MWYIGQEITETENLDSNSQGFLYDQTVFDSFLRPIGQIDKSNNELYTAYDSTGFFYYIPSSLKEYLLSTSKNCYNNSGFEPRCRPWYAATRSNSNHDEVVLTLPYLFIDTNLLGQTACIGTWKQDELLQVTCLDYRLESQQESSLPANSYSFILDNELKIFYHPNQNRSDSNVYSISELEFGLSDYSEKNSETSYFEDNIIPLFDSDVTEVARYENRGESL